MYNQCRLAGRGGALTFYLIACSVQTPLMG